MLLLLLACSDYELSPDIDVQEGEVSCDDWPQPADYAVDADSECLADPDVGNFEPIVEWRWSGHPDHESFTNVVSTPVVGSCKVRIGSNSSPSALNTQGFARSRQGEAIWAH